MEQAVRTAGMRQATIEDQGILLSVFPFRALRMGVPCGIGFNPNGQMVDFCIGTGLLYDVEWFLSDVSAVNTGPRLFQKSHLIRQRRDPDEVRVEERGGKCRVTKRYIPHRQTAIRKNRTCP
jgi:hypothetical protein